MFSQREETFLNIKKKENGICDATQKELRAGLPLAFLYNGVSVEINHPEELKGLLDVNPLSP